MKDLATKPCALRLRGTFIDMRPDLSEIEDSFRYSSKGRSASSPPSPSNQTVEGPARSFEHCSDEYLQGLVSRVMKLSSPKGLLASECKHADDKSFHEEKISQHNSEASKVTGFPHQRLELRDLQAQALQPCLPSLSSPQKIVGASGRYADFMPGQSGDGLQELEEEEAVTTLMIRNIPCKMTLQAMIDLVEEHGFAGKYDFLHLPGRGRPFSNLGYAFINFYAPETVAGFMSKFQGVAFSKISCINTEKIIELRPARAQGFAENLAKVRHVASNRDESSLVVVTHGSQYIM